MVGVADKRGSQVPIDAGAGVPRRQEATNSAATERESIRAVIDRDKQYTLCFDDRESTGLCEFVVCYQDHHDLSGRISAA